MLKQLNRSEIDKVRGRTAEQEEEDKRKDKQEGTRVWAVVCTDLHGVMAPFYSREAAERMRDDVNRDGACRYEVVGVIVNMAADLANSAADLAADRLN